MTLNVRNENKSMGEEQQKVEEINQEQKIKDWNSNCNSTIKENNSRMCIS